MSGQMDKLMAKVAFSEPVDITEELRDAIRCCPHELASPIELMVVSVKLV